ncbi:MAG: hypothetical protein ACREGI_01400, partial [Candidatus Levyibacteriota bacterium]
VMVYLMTLWFVVPWIVFSTYNGEISDYYFAINRFIVLLIIGYLLAKFWELPTIFPKLAVVCLLLFYSYANLGAFFNDHQDDGIRAHRRYVTKLISQGVKVQYQWGNPDSFFYYFLYERKHRKF